MLFIWSNKDLQVNFAEEQTQNKNLRNRKNIYTTVIMQNVLQFGFRK